MGMDSMGKLRPPKGTGRVVGSLRSWRYCEIKVLAAEPRSQKRSGDEAFDRGFAARDGCRQISLDYITTAPPPNVTRLLQLGTWTELTSCTLIRTYSHRYVRV